MNATEIPTDPRFQATGPGAYYEIDALIREHFEDAAVNSMRSRATYLTNTGHRPSSALRHAIREHISGNVYHGVTA